MSQQAADQLVFMYEGGSNIALTPLYARAPKENALGERSTKPRQERDADCFPLCGGNGRIDDH